MNPKHLLIVFYSVIFPWQLVFADIFVVISNADNGPGTLREAITLANGNGTVGIDYIHFDIADNSLTGRTIILESYLPALSSNIVIDANTQTGSVFGVSDAKIRITTNGSETYSQCFILRNVEGIEIYGFYITDFRYGDADIPNVTRCAIWMEGIVKRIKIGAPGKGNVFFNNGLAICTPYGYSTNEGHHFSDIIIQSNFFNLDVDGKTYTRYEAWTCVIISSFTNIDIGGDDPESGNYFSGLNGDAAVLISDNVTGNGVLNVKNNTFGSTFDKASSVPCGAINIYGYEFSIWNKIFSDLEVNIINNTFRNPAVQFSNACHHMISISCIYGFIKITGNTIGTPSGFSFECQTTGIGISACKDGIIGGDNPEDQNIIASNYNTGIVLKNNKNITIKRNSIFCNGKGIEAESSFVEVPEVKIMSTNNIDYLAGTATPNCTIEVFQNIKQCLECNNGEIYMGKTTSDAEGNWSFTGSFSGPVTARPTSSAGVSGEFSTAKFVQARDFQGPVCGKNNGYIKGVQLISGTKYYWVRRYNGQTDTIFNTLDLIDVGPGRYNFVVEQTKFCSVSYAIELTDLSPQIYIQYVSVYDPSCGQSNGKILDVGVNGLYNKLYWLSYNGDTAGVSKDLINVPEGKYKFVVLNETYGCGDSTSYYTLINKQGPSLVYDNMQITSSFCNNSNGSIKGMTVKNNVGRINVQWLDSVNNVVGTAFDLWDKPAGKYRLKYKDDSGCDTITTPYFTILPVGAITIDTAGKTVIAAGCTIPNGSIANISVLGAERWQWKSLENNSIVGNSKDASLLKAGSYQLIATNHYNCESVSPVISVPAAIFAPISPVNTTVFNAACGQNNGNIKIDGFVNERALESYHWNNSKTNEDLGSKLNITGLGEGSYELIAVDTNGCSQTIFKSDIKVNAKPQINKSSLSILNDKCDLGQGSITGLQVNGLANTPVYLWKNIDGAVVGTSVDLRNVTSGSYQLTVKDGEFCIATSDIFDLTNDNSDPLPLYEDLFIPRNTSATLKVNNYSDGTYALYSDRSGTQLIESNSTGIFNTPVLNSDKYIYIQHINGYCSSPLRQVKITVVDKSEFAVPTAFTPNNDGLNDILHVKVIGFIDLEYFKIFNRFGKEIFSARNINAGWDGTVNGALQNSGVFIWMAKGKDILGKTVEAKGTVALIK